ncbi:MAG: hypothetical protein K9H49_15605 [Bacteroidales bacterium]|nr:hypothetical protein [Bacteroidales bacterium]MCF8405493.1 hypothetical protein [Bacteroidales bacterium]
MKLFLTVFLLLVFTQSYSQRKIALHSNGSTTLFGGETPYVDAYNAAQNGDTIYLPGGQFTAPHISKHVVVFGVGHNPDSTTVQGETIINGFNFNAGSAKSHFEGLKITSGITWSSIADSIVIKRCNITGNISFSSYASKAIQITENVIAGSISGASVINTDIANNIIKRNGNNVISSIKNNAWIHNNIIVGRGYVLSYVAYFVLFGITDCLIENNIILNEGTSPANIMSTTSNNTFRNNLFNGNPSDLINIWENNYFDIASSSIFNNYIGMNFDYAEDYHLVDPATYIGTTSNEVGVYGGYTPFKEGAVPSNPHLRFKSISTQTNASGELNVNISVGAQDN